MNCAGRFAFSLQALVLAMLLPGSLWAQGNFVFTNNDQVTNTISAFSVGADGTLTQVAGSPFATGGAGSGGGLFASNRIGATVAGDLLFAANTETDNISVFKIDPSTGVLTAVPGSPFATGNVGGNAAGISVSATPDGRFLMAASFGSSNVAVFSIGSNGALSPITGSPFPTQANPFSITISPNGKFLAVAEGDVEMFSIASSGSLTSLGLFPSGLARGLDMNCSTTSLFAGESDGTVTIMDAFNLASSGALAPVPGSPFITGPGADANGVALSPDGKTLFVSNQLSNTVTVFSAAADGTLSQVAGSPFAMNGAVITPAGVATSQDGSFLYVADTTPAISVFKIGTGGTLTEVVGSPFSITQERGLHALTAFPPKSCAPPAPPVLTVGIEIKPPAVPPVPINPRSPGKIPVAILSTSSFNAVTQVDPKSVTFGATGNEASLAFCNPDGEDVNGDGLPDLVCHFFTRRTGFSNGSTSAMLKGKTVSGAAIQGSEAITTVPRHHDDNDNDHDDKH
ncbi:MAG: lactonase family protein [Actinomycetota bacterium]